MNKVTAILRLTRVEHSFMLVIAVLAAELITKGLPTLPILALSLITPIFVSMGSFAINDYFDVEADRANKRLDMPIVSGAVSKNGAVYTFCLCMLIGIGASLFINAYAFVIALVFGALAFIYSYRLKGTLLLGNAYIALSMVIPFMFGDFVVSGMVPANIVLICFVIFLSGLAREIHGMIRDYRGDVRARKVKNLIHHIGARRSAYIAALLYVEAIAISVFMFFFMPPFWHNLVYMVPILVVDAMLLYVSLGYVLYSSRKFFNASRNLSLGAMALALVVYLATPLIYVPL